MILTVFSWARLALVMAVVFAVIIVETDLGFVSESQDYSAICKALNDQAKGFFFCTPNSEINQKK